jgi:predicted nucleic acid-binding protein
MPHLSDLPTGHTVFLDANIFLEHLLRGEPACTTLFQRLRRGDISAIASVLVLSEVRHRLLLTEVVRQGHASETQRALDVLRRQPHILPHLKPCDAGLTLLLQTPLRIVSVTPAQFRLAQRLSIRYRLLTNDALHLAVMRAHRLRHLASADKDFRRVPRLTLWSP